MPRGTDCGEFDIGGNSGWIKVKAGGRLAPAAEGGFTWSLPNLWIRLLAAAGAAATNVGLVGGECALVPFRFSLPGCSPGLLHSQPTSASAGYAG